MVNYFFTYTRVCPASVIILTILLLAGCGREEKRSVPNLVTLAVTEISSNTATGGGHVYGDGNSKIVARGIVWSTGPQPSLELNSGFTDEEPGMGSFHSYMTDLEYRVQYFVRAYAVNAEGVSYGEEISFTTACEDITITHEAGTVAPESITVTYRTVKSSLSGEPKCWIVQNLGAVSPAQSATDDSEETAGWYWQFNRKQGYMHDSGMRLPESEWLGDIEQDRNWLSTEDPCAILLGFGWRLPTVAEWEKVHTEGKWNSYDHTFDSELKLHAAGLLRPGDGSLYGRGVYGAYWTSDQFNSSFGKYLYFYGGSSTMFHYAFSSFGKSTGMTLRCVNDRLF